MSKRVFNFSPGPAALSEIVLKRAAEEMLDFQGTGMSVMEISHRSDIFREVMSETEDLFRELLGISDDYAVLFLQGGGTLQFSMVPMNLMTGSGKADYIVSGMWAKKAFEEAGKFGDAKQVASSQSEGFTYIPKINAEDVRSDADYLYIAWNNTIYGTQYKAVPQSGGVPLVADMSSCIFSEKINVDDFALIFACAQKMFGPAGLTAVIVRKGLLGKAGADTPVYLDYKTHYDGDSLYNTPPTYCIYIAWLTLKHLKEIGGVEVVQEMTERRASRLYSFIDESSLFTIPAAREDRSSMNALFVTGDESLDRKFIAQAASEGLVNLGGHRSTGGMRASMYNWLPDEAVDKLIDFMYRFEKDNKVK